MSKRKLQIEVDKTSDIDSAWSVHIQEAAMVAYDKSAGWRTVDDFMTDCIASGKVIIRQAASNYLKECYQAGLMEREKIVVSGKRCLIYRPIEAKAPH